MIKSVSIFFLGQFQGKKKKKSPNLEEKGKWPLKFDPFLFIFHFFRKYKIYALLWYQVYPNRMKNKVSVI